ncbi:MAG: 6,7-dimethyl-8-ribityllumazine synthase [Acidimicrobiia bacterium]|nr:6,7-dimethyl-8-ribityllumazine synthase [Acidimicrobiia bacterium]MBT8215390.1 6,7-dimethyl-8-ribityllumazine synthase [Acidimicrobiia bacterium]NNF10812.1 6,7-dimethyl-8-ribityllumazine synthase [Acidimicrobiia bacterium]NNL70419.1 6,7-dimethyl-8-ribityllumazine synthase [Acidimicrobiia bacterium]
MSGPALRGDFDAGGLKVGVAAATFNAEITDGLLDGALSVLDDAEVTVVRVSGSFELPLVAQALVDAGNDAVVAIGAVILGETDHYEHIARETARGLQDVMLRTGVPVSFGVLTVREADHARTRSLPGPGNKGTEAAEAAVTTARLLQELRSS